MEIHQISFAKIAIINKELAEVTVDNAVDIDLVMVEEIHEALLSLLNPSFSLLINKSNAYSTQLDALIKFGALPAIDKIAIFAPNKLSQMSADFSATIPSSQSLTIQIFIERESALAWLL